MHGWIHSIRDHKKILFAQLWDPHLYNSQAPDLDPDDPGSVKHGEYIQLVFSGDLLKKHREQITMQAYIKVSGTYVDNPKSPTDGLEIHVREFQLIGAGSDAFSSELNEDSDTHVLMKKRHLLHWKHQGQTHQLMILRDMLYRAIHQYYFNEGLLKVDPPTIVPVQTEGGSTLFKLDFYGKDAFLTQSSQLYLESLLPGYGGVWCLESSYRAEKSRTTRHLAEYKHLEAEYITDSMDHLMFNVEQLVRYLFRAADAGLDKKPFMRMTYWEAIDHLNRLNIRKPDGSVFSYDDDINDSAEMQLLEEFKCPIFLTHFPAHLKAFYMERVVDPSEIEGDPAIIYTNSFDLLLPGVGETVGGSMRMTDYQQLLTAFQEAGIDPEPYQWYLDTRKYGSCPHGGYGLGLERLIKAIMWAKGTPIQHVRDACLYPVYY